MWDSRVAYVQSLAVVLMILLLPLKAEEEEGLSVVYVIPLCNERGGVAQGRTFLCFAI